LIWEPVATEEGMTATVGGPNSRQLSASISKAIVAAVKLKTLASPFLAFADRTSLVTFKGQKRVVAGLAHWHRVVPVKVSVLVLTEA